MPRTGRGGSRTGTPGVAHPQRTDLNENRQPITPVPGGGYGDRQASIDAQRIAPLPAGTPTPTGPPPPSPGGGMMPPSAFGALPALNAPTDRPHEPLTAGLSTGPGPGPEAIGLGAPGPDLSKLAAYLPALEVLANRPGTTQETRNFVRLVRSNAPTGA